MALFQNRPSLFMLYGLFIAVCSLVIWPFVHNFLPNIKSSLRDHFKKSLTIQDELSKGDNLYEQGKKQAAVFYYRKVLSSQPLAYYYFKLGIILAENGRYEDAIELYKEAVRLKPAYFEVYLNIGRAYKELNLYAEAVESFHKVINLKPDFYLTYIDMGEVYLNIGETESAKRYFQNGAFLLLGQNKIKEDAKDDAVVYYTLGLLMDKNGRYDEAIKNYKKAIKSILCQKEKNE